MKTALFNLQANANADTVCWSGSAIKKNTRKRITNSYLVSQ